MKITHYDLFAGIGGFSLALKNVFNDQEIKTVFCEWDSFCTAVLKKHFPEAEYWGDIAELVAYTNRNRLAGGDKEIDPSSGTQQAQRNLKTGDKSPSLSILTGGFPCQPFSQAGRRKGTGDDRIDRDACACGEQCGIIEICNGDTTTSVRDARRDLAGRQKEEEKQRTQDTAKSVRLSINGNGEQGTNNGDGRTRSNGRTGKKTRYSRDMEGNVPVVEKPTESSSQSTMSTEGETRNGGNTTIRHGDSSCETNTRRTNIKSSATTATMRNTDSERVLTILTGGFPCQPFSHAGRRKGTSDERYKWPEMFRVIQNTKPDWVIAENVSGIATWNEGLVFETVCSDLEKAGYEVQPLRIPACAVGAPHRRDRWWFVAHRTSWGTRRSESEGGGIGQPEAEIRNGDSDAQNPISKRSRGRNENSRQILERESPEAEDARPSWESNWPEVASALCDVAYGLPSELLRSDGERDRNYPWWRTQALKAGGNAIVSQVAEQIFKALKSTLTPYLG